MGVARACRERDEQGTHGNGELRRLSEGIVAKRRETSAWGNESDLPAAGLGLNNLSAAVLDAVSELDALLLSEGRLGDGLP